jgi:hypothetical protein
MTANDRLNSLQELKHPQRDWSRAPQGDSTNMVERARWDNAERQHARELREWVSKMLGLLSFNPLYHSRFKAASDIILADNGGTDWVNAAYESESIITSAKADLRSEIKREQEQESAALRIHKETLAQAEAQHRETVDLQQKQFRVSIREARIAAAISIAAAIAAFLSAWYARVQVLTSSPTPTSSPATTQAPPISIRVPTLLLDPITQQSSPFSPIYPVRGIATPWPLLLPAKQP